MPMLARGGGGNGVTEAAASCSTMATRALAATCTARPPSLPQPPPARWPRLLECLNTYKPVVWEYSRLNITNNVLSKRKLNKLVTDKHVNGWDDPRLLTLSGACVCVVGPVGWQQEERRQRALQPPPTGERAWTRSAIGNVLQHQASVWHAIDLSDTWR